MAATKLSIETRADGSGVVVPTQLLRQADAITVYSIGRDDNGVFVSNVAATAWSIQSATGGVVSGDLVAAIDLKSAVFTAHSDGSGIIHATSSLVTTPNADSGTLTVFDHALVTLDQVKQYLGFASTSKDTLLLDWVKRVTGLIESRLEQPVYPREVTDILNGSGGSIQFLESGRIISLTGTDDTAKLASLQTRASSADSWTNIATDINSVVIDSISRWSVELLDGAVFPFGRKNIRIAFSAGFATDSRDYQELTDLSLEFFQVMWEKSKQGGDLLAKQSKNIAEGGMSTNLSLKDMDSEWQKRLDHYRKLSYSFA